jgi:branched-subunit amino acid aminotransferase/4-amino-4-deoxychorismate lyase
MYVYLNGDFVSEQDAKVSVLDHGFLYGDGVFEGIRAYDGRIFGLDEHVDRFYESAHSIMLELPLSRDEMKETIIEAVRRNNLRDASHQVPQGDPGHHCGRGNPSPRRYRAEAHKRDGNQGSERLHPPQWP